MGYELLVKNGIVIDGSGSPGYRADVGVVDGKIAAIGRINESAKQTIDADGHIVSPGFVDGHTHMGCSDFLGSDWLMLLLSRGHQRGDGQLWIHASAVQARRCGHGLSQPRASRGFIPRRHARRYRLALGDLSRVSRCY